MNDTPRWEILIAKYLDGACDDAEAAELEALLAAEPAAAEALVRSARMDALLEAVVAQRKAGDRAEAVVASLKEPPASFWHAWRVPLLGGMLALLLLLGGIAYFARQSLLESQQLAQRPNVVLSGTVLVDGEPATRVGNGQRVSVSADAPAALRLPDGSRAELAPRTTAVVHGAAGAMRQRVELVQGSGSFQVAKGQGEFQVATPVGQVVVWGTDFTVTLLPEEQFAAAPKAPKARTPGAMEVAVREGIVEVEYGRHRVLLAAGEEATIRDDHEPRAARETSGRFDGVDPAAGTIRLKSGGDNPKIEELPLSPEARVVMDGRPATFDQIPSSTQLRLTHSQGGTVVAVHATGPTRQGVVRGIDPAARTITLVAPRGEGGQSRDRVFRLSEQVAVFEGDYARQLDEVPDGARVSLVLSVDQREVVRIELPRPKEERERER